MNDSPEPQSNDREPLQRIPRRADDDYCPEAVAARLALARSVSQAPLEHLAGAPVDPGSARGNIENLVGYAQVPVGLAGPLRLDGEQGVYEVYVPMATTEGAMVASYSRGMGVLREAGGARARMIASKLSQHPMLVYRDAAAALHAAGIAAEMRAEFEAWVAGSSSVGRLVGLFPEVLGRRLVLRLEFATGDAVGINMAARAAEHCSGRLAEQTGALECHVHGQDVEKRANGRALVQPRGRSVVCDATLPAELVRRRLRVEPADLAAIAATYAVGYAQLGTQNWTVQAANGLGAIFLACGQDVAYLTESATGWLDLSVTAAGDLYAGVHLPNLLLGTVGGGSGQGTAAECLALLGCAGAGRSTRFAEILAGAVLAGDLSLMASFCAGDFVAAHERLGRNRPAGSLDSRPSH